MIVALAAILVGSVLIYAAVTGRSVTALLTGNSQQAQPNRSLTG